jgi:hypothetical protein
VQCTAVAAACNRHWGVTVHGAALLVAHSSGEQCRALVRDLDAEYIQRCFAQQAPVSLSTAAVCGNCVWHANGTVVCQANSASVRGAARVQSIGL